MVLAAALLAAAFGGVAAELVARVNGEPVTQDELRRLLASPAAQAELKQELGIRQRDARALHRLAVQKLIEQRLLLQEARRRDFKVADKEFDQALLKVRRRFDGLNEFGAWMKSQGLDDRSLIETIRKDLLISRAAAALVESATVTADEVRAYYESHKSTLAGPSAVRLQMIVVKERLAAEEIVAAAGTGTEFGELAREKSLGMRSAQGGDTEWVRRQDLPAALAEAIRGAKNGDIVGPLWSGTDYRVVRIVDQRPGRIRTLAEVRPEIYRSALLAKQKKLLAAWRQDQQSRATIELLP